MTTVPAGRSSWRSSSTSYGAFCTALDGLRMPWWEPGAPALHYASLGHNHACNNKLKKIHFPCGFHDRQRTHSYYTLNGSKGGSGLAPPIVRPVPMFVAALARRPIDLAYISQHTTSLCHNHARTRSVFYPFSLLSAPFVRPHALAHHRHALILGVAISTPRTLRPDVVTTC